jgi:hypothetical protein
MLRRSLRSLITASAFATLVSATGVASAEETAAEPARPAAVERARIISYVAMSAGAAAMATGVGLYAVGTASFPEGCTLQSCDVRHANGMPSTETLPCARNARADGCVGSPYNVSRQTETGKAEAMKSAGLVTTTLGAVALAAGFVLWLRTPGAEEAPPDPGGARTVASAQLVPVVGVGYGGVGLVADF